MTTFAERPVVLASAPGPDHLPPMSDAPMYLLEPAGPPREEVVDRLPAGIVAVESMDSFLALSPPDHGGVLVLGPTLPPAEVVRALETRGRAGSGWLTVRVVRGEDDLEFRPVTLGFPARARDLVSRARGETPEEPVMDMDSLLHAFSRIRHDMNNPLTSALTETQLLLLDVTEEETRTALRSVERQLGRIRDLIRDLSRFRPPTDRANRIG